MSAKPSQSGVPPRVLITTCMKDEGPFILDWIAHHRVVGVTDFLVFTNDCSDGSNFLLEALNTHGVVRHVPNPAFLTPYPTQFQPVALHYTYAFLRLFKPDYIISMDVDEYINIKIGDGHLTDLFEATGPFDVLLMSELNFGWNNQRSFVPEPVTARFTRAESYQPGPRFRRRGVKSIVRSGVRLQLGNHRPKLPAGEGPENYRWFDGSGRLIEPVFLLSEDNGRDCHGSYDNVQLNHYALRDLESFVMKHERGDVVSATGRVGRRYWRVRNQSTQTELSVARYADAVAAEKTRLLQLPRIAALQDATIDAWQRKIAQLHENPDLQTLWQIAD